MNKLTEIQELLTKYFDPIFMAVTDESHLHRSSDSHYKIVIQSAKFDHLNLLARQRLVYKALQGVVYHALSVHAFDSNESFDVNHLKGSSCLNSHSR